MCSQKSNLKFGGDSSSSCNGSSKAEQTKGPLLVASVAFASHDVLDSVKQQLSECIALRDASYLHRLSVSLKRPRKFHTDTLCLPYIIPVSHEMDETGSGRRRCGKQGIRGKNTLLLQSPGMNAREDSS